MSPSERYCQSFICSEHIFTQALNHWEFVLTETSSKIRYLNYICCPHRVVTFVLKSVWELQKFVWTIVSLFLNSHRPVINLLSHFLILRSWILCDIFNWGTIDYLLPLIFLHEVALHLQNATSSCNYYIGNLLTRVIRVIPLLLNLGVSSVNLNAERGST